MGGGDKSSWVIESRCPLCGNIIEVRDHIRDIPHVGRVIISHGRCDKCRFRYSDVRMLESRGPQRLKIEVNGPDDLNILVVRASTASIRIPELGVSIDPGPSSHGFLTTIEGILFRVRDILEFIKDDEDVDRVEWDRRYRLLLDALEGRLRFTLEIIDPYGVSKIISEREVREELSPGQ